MTTAYKQQQKTLLELASKAQSKAYAPYSNFKVGAAIFDNNQKHHGGCNVENASYPLCQCAEAGAIASMIASGSQSITEILILSPNNDFCPPCGGCRQKIAEFANEKTLVHLAKQNGDVKTVNFSELLPLAFGFEKSDV
ncbi:cytidine deaminase [Paraglaciecola sp. 2405UD69-4]|uniref:cytidine deaminase n=1 Tax=Paraglaciecola sp. 2405UD69-4 TaxID=3391836 RepID=UPI0039C9EC23